jgi:ABC-type multidrug transport system permease subunit
VSFGVDIPLLILAVLSLAAVVGVWVLAVVLVARDARRRGMFWQWWTFAVAFIPVSFGVGYLMARGGNDPA